jgi:NodT family efflux transporter outer membrane factor (OMF) lipoprotein
MRAGLFSISISTVAILLAACGSMPKPAVTMPPVWQAPVGDATGVAEPVGALWWRDFGSTELDVLITQAIRNNHDLRIAYARVLQSEAGARGAASALLPTVSASGSASRRQNQVAGGPDDIGTSYSAGLQASYQVDLFGQARSSAASAEQRLESSLYDRETVTITLISNVITAYLQVLSARERQQLTSERLNNAEAILKLLETQRRIGTLSELELAQQRAALANQRAVLPALRLAERQALNTLAVLLGRPPQGFDVEGRALSSLALPVVAAGIPSTLLVRRPDLRRAESDLAAANFDVSAARAARLPGIQLTASGGTASAALASLFSAGTFAYTVGGSIAQTLFAGGRLAAQEDAARARYQEIAAGYEQAVIAAFSDVENALTAVATGDEQYAFAQEASTQADLAYRLAELRYRAGVVDFQTVLNAQNQAFSSQESVVQNRLARFNAVIGLTLALGGGWDGTLPSET